MHSKDNLIKLSRFCPTDMGREQNVTYLCEIFYLEDLELTISKYTTVFLT